MREEDRLLLEFVLGHALGIVCVRVPRALVVSVEVLDGVEAREAHVVEGDMVGAADALVDVAGHAQVAERRQPAIEDLFESEWTARILWLSPLVYCKIEVGAAVSPNSK